MGASFFRARVWSSCKVSCSHRTNIYVPSMNLSIGSLNLLLGVRLESWVMWGLRFDILVIFNHYDCLHQLVRGEPGSFDVILMKNTQTQSARNKTTPCCFFQLLSGLPVRNFWGCQKNPAMASKCNYQRFLDD